MKKLLIILVILSIIGFSTPVFAAKGGQRGASSQALEHANENAVFNRVSDWFATVGKSEEEKAKILEERKAKRAAKEAEKEAKKAEKKVKKEAKKAGKKMKSKKMKMKGMKKK